MPSFYVEDLRSQPRFWNKHHYPNGNITYTSTQRAFIEFTDYITKTQYKLYFKGKEQVYYFHLYKEKDVLLPVIMYFENSLSTRQI